MNVTFDLNVLRIADANGIIIEQPNWPDGTEWANEQEARTWADLWIAYISSTDSSAPKPPDGPS